MATYNRETVYDYMDGGAEVYLEYGMRQVSVQKYAKVGSPPVSFGLFEMDSPAGAYGAFTFENEDEDAGVGQGSEYGGGLLRFWHNRYFGFVQAEMETPDSKAAVLALGKAVAQKLGTPGEKPDLPNLLPLDGLRPRSVRYALSPLLLQVLEASMLDNPMGLPPRCEAAIGRYGPKGNLERVIVVRCKEKGVAERAILDYLGKKAAGEKPSAPFKTEGGWCLASACGDCAVLVIGAAGKEAAMARLSEAIKILLGARRSGHSLCLASKQGWVGSEAEAADLLALKPTAVGFAQPSAGREGTVPSRPR